MAELRLFAYFVNGIFQQRRNFAFIFVVPRSLLVTFSASLSIFFNSILPLPFNRRVDSSIFRGWEHVICRVLTNRRIVRMVHPSPGISVPVGQILEAETPQDAVLGFQEMRVPQIGLQIRGAGLDAPGLRVVDEQSQVRCEIQLAIEHLGAGEVLVVVDAGEIREALPGIAVEQCSVVACQKDLVQADDLDGMDELVRGQLQLAPAAIVVVPAFVAHGVDVVLAAASDVHEVDGIVLVQPTVEILAIARRGIADGGLAHGAREIPPMPIQHLGGAGREPVDLP